MMWFRVVGLIVVVIVIAAMGGWWLIRGQAGPAPAAALAETPKSGDAAVEKQPLPKIDKDALTLPGIIEPYESVPVSAKLTANIAAMKVRDSTLVTKSELLCVLDDIDLRQDIDAAKLALMQAQETLRRSKETHSADLERKRVVTATAQTDLESFRSESAAQIQQAEAALRRAQTEAERYQKLYQSNAISEEQVRLKREAAEDAQTTLEQRKAAAGAGIASRQKALEQAQLEAGQESVSEKDIIASELAVTNARNEFSKRERKKPTSAFCPRSGEQCTSFLARGPRPWWRRGPALRSSGRACGCTRAIPSWRSPPPSAPACVSRWMRPTSVGSTSACPRRSPAMRSPGASWPGEYRRFRPQAERRARA